MRFLVRPPPVELAPLIEHLWYFAGALPAGRERLLPSGEAQLLVNLDADRLSTWDADGRAVVARTGGAAFAGPRTRPIGIDLGDQRAIVGVSFRLGGAAAFVGGAGDALGAIADGDVDLGDLWGRDGAVVRERVLEAGEPDAALAALAAILRERLVRPVVIDPAVIEAARALDRGAAVGRIAARLGLSERQLLRRFTAQIGLTPKRFARVRRFQRVLRAAGAGADWARVAVDHGYYDQAHLIHEFRELAGMCPTAYRPRAAGSPNHVALPAEPT